MMMMMMMEEQTMTKNILNLTLKLICLLTGEIFTVVKSGDLMAIIAPQHHFVIPQKTNKKKILELINKMVELLTGEVPIRCQDVAVYLSMEERQYLEGHRQLYKAAMMEEEPADGSRKTNPPERAPHPFNSLESTQEGSEIPHHEQNGNPSQSIITVQERMKVKDKEHSEGHKELPKTAMMEDQPVDGSGKRNLPEGWPHPFYFWDATQEGLVILLQPQNGDSGHFNGVSTEEMKEQEVENGGTLGFLKPCNDVYNSVTMDVSSGDTPERCSHPLYCQNSTRDGQEIGHYDSRGIPNNSNNIYKEKDNNIIEPSNYSAHKDHHNNTFTEVQTPVTPPDGTRNPAERSPHLCYSQDSTPNQPELYSQPLDFRDFTLEDHNYSSQGKDTTYEDALELLVTGDEQTTGDRKLAVVEKEALSVDISSASAYDAKTPQEASLTLAPDCDVDDDDTTQGSQTDHPISSNLHPDLPIVDRSPGPSNGETPPVDGSDPVKCDADKKFQCSECGRKFKSKSSYNRHLSTHSEKKLFLCSECGNHYETKATYQRHMRVHTGTFLCSECGKRFISKTTYLSHLAIHPKGSPFSCSECGKCFRLKLHLLNHMALHSDKRQLSCSECGKSFVGKSQLKRHQKCHTEEKPHVCSECGKQFARKSRLAIHQRLHTGERPFSCTECGRGYTGKANLVAHLKHYHMYKKPHTVL